MIKQLIASVILMGVVVYLAWEIRILSPVHPPVDENDATVVGADTPLNYDGYFYVDIPPHKIEKLLSTITINVSILPINKNNAQILRYSSKGYGINVGFDPNPFPAFSLTRFVNEENPEKLQFDVNTERNFDITIMFATPYDIVVIVGRYIRTLNLRVNQLVEVNRLFLGGFPSQGVPDIGMNGIINYVKINHDEPIRRFHYVRK